MAEFRLTELGTRSGVSVRNIRAYRERGLLDPPRREGRSAFYDDRHLAQLKIINELLQRGFTTAHIAEFFTGMRRGRDLADILGLHRAVFGGSGPTAAVAVPVDPDSDEASRLLALGLADSSDGGLSMNPRLAEIVDRAADAGDYVRVLLRVSDGIADSLDEVADSVVKALEDSVISRFGPNYVPRRPEDVDELRQILSDYRALGSRVVADRLDAAMQKHLVDTVSSDGVLAGRRQPADS